MDAPLMPRAVLVALAGDDPAKQQLLAAWDREHELRHAAEEALEEGRRLCKALMEQRDAWQLRADELSACLLPPQQDGIALIAAERQRQISYEGWTPEHDDTHDQGEMIEGARAYLSAAFLAEVPRRWIGEPPPTWPWNQSWWKPSDDPIRNLIKAGALIAAEIDRLQRRRGEVAGLTPHPERECAHGHKIRQVGCVSCVLVFDRPAERVGLTPPPQEKHGQEDLRQMVVVEMAERQGVPSVAADKRQNQSEGSLARDLAQAEAVTRTAAAIKVK